MEHNGDGSVNTANSRADAWAALCLIAIVVTTAIVWVSQR